jgi:hypothetical protein
MDYSHKNNTHLCIRNDLKIPCQIINNHDMNFDKKIYNITSVALCFYRKTQVAKEKYVLQYLMDNTGDTLDFPRYNLSYKPFTIHEPGTGAGTNTGRNELSTRRIFEIARKFLFNVTDKANTRWSCDILIYSDHKKYNDTVYLFIDVGLVNFNVCKNAQFCSVDELVNYDERISPNVTNFVLNHMSSFTIDPMDNLPSFTVDMMEEDGEPAA